MFQSSISPVKNEFVVKKKKPNRELSMGEMEDILKHWVKPVQQFVTSWKRMNPLVYRATDTEKDGQIKQQQLMTDVVKTSLLKLVKTCADWHDCDTHNCVLRTEP